MAAGSRDGFWIVNSWQVNYVQLKKMTRENDGDDSEGTISGAFFRPSFTPRKYSYSPPSEYLFFQPFTSCPVALSNVTHPSQRLHKCNAYNYWSVLHSPPYRHTPTMFNRGDMLYT